MLDSATVPENISQLQAWELWFQNVDILNKTLLFGLSVRNWDRIGKCLQAAAALTVILDIIGAEAVRNFGSWLKGVTAVTRAKSVAVTGLQIFADTFARGWPDIMFRRQHVYRHTRRLGQTVITFFTKGTPSRARIVALVRSVGRRVAVIRKSKKGTRRKNLWRTKRFPPGMKFQRVENVIIKPVTTAVMIIFTGLFLLDDYQKGFKDGIFLGIFAAILAALFLTLITAVVLAYALLMVRLALPVVLLVAALFAFGSDKFLIKPTAWVIGHQKNENLIKGVAIVVFLVGFYFDLLAS